MITERTLKKWRREALEYSEVKSINGAPGSFILNPEKEELHKRILRMTQELLDQHLLRRNVR